MPELDWNDIERQKLREEIERLRAAVREAVDAFGVVLSSMETCHICHGTLALDDTGATHCENCSWDCDEHDEPACEPPYVLHARASKALDRLKLLAGNAS